MDDTFEGLTELRAGVYTAGDLFQANIGTLPRASIALSVMATVISHNRSRNQIVIDAGGLALSKDRSTAQMSADFGYGLVSRRRAIPRSARSSSRMSTRNTVKFAALSRCSSRNCRSAHACECCRIACMTAAMYEHYWIVDGGETIMDRWSPINGWEEPGPTTLNYAECLSCSALC